MNTVPITVLLLAWLGNCAGRPEGPGGLALVTGPLNVADYVESTVTLNCSSDNSVGSHIVWTEFASTPGGAKISDNDVIDPSHPNAARYVIIHVTPDQFDLVISNVDLSDGGTYLCEDINAVLPEKTRAQAEFIVIESAANCTTTVGSTGVVMENQLHTMECAVSFQGNVAPTMSWTGPPPFQVGGAVGETSVWSGISFVVNRAMNEEIFDCLTNFTQESFAQPPPDGATNPPSFSYLYTFPQIIVNWGPKGLYIVPVKPYYSLGDVVTCYADANPPASFQWQNMRTLVTTPGTSFTVTDDFEGLTTTMRCQAQNTIQGVIYAANLFTDINVLEPTTAEATTTTKATSTVATTTASHFTLTEASSPSASFSPSATPPPNLSSSDTPSPPDPSASTPSPPDSSASAPFPPDSSASTPSPSDSSASTPSPPDSSAITLPPSGSSTTVSPGAGSCDSLLGRWQATDPTATLCLNVIDPVNGQVTGLLKTQSDNYYIEIVGRASTDSRDLIGWSGVWPESEIVTSFVGECHKCNGSDVLIADPLSRSISLSPQCGMPGEQRRGETYEFRRQGPPCTGATFNVRNPTHTADDS